MARTSLIALTTGVSAGLILCAPAALAQDTAQPAPTPSASAPPQQVPVLRGQYSLPPGETETGPPVQGPILPNAPVARPSTQATPAPQPSASARPTPAPSARPAAPPAAAPARGAATNAAPVRPEVQPRVEQPTAQSPQFDFTPPPEAATAPTPDSAPVAAPSVPSLSDAPTGDAAEDQASDWGIWPWVLLGLLLVIGAGAATMLLRRKREVAVAYEKIEPYRPPVPSPAEPEARPAAAPPPQQPSRPEPATANAGGFVTSSIPARMPARPAPDSGGFVTTPVRQMSPDGRITTSLGRNRDRS